MKKILTICFAMALAITPVFALDEEVTLNEQTQAKQIQTLNKEVQTTAIQDSNNSIKIFSMFKKNKNTTPEVIITEQEQDTNKAPIKLDANAIERELIMEYQQSQVNSMVP